MPAPSLTPVRLPEQAAQRRAGGPQQHLLWLTFSDRGLEREFARWHSIQLQKVRRPLYAL
jgi:hypothetical protein